MSITDELRKYARIHQPYKSELYNAQCTDEIVAIADRIDAAHERTYRNLTDALHKQEDVTRELDKKSVLLPRDADGVPTHLGDELTDGKNTYTVTSIVFNSCNVVVYGCTETNKSEWPIDQASKMHHAEHTTVEDVLQDVVTLCHNIWKAGSASERYDVDDVMNSGNIADYADRIREVLRDE